ncbi:hypothetical protein STA3757_26550 [Stanieria sp. NIES-3757]|nr:hypothetical protein STA3757_26550 [Stanieria sp. NIES-3757]
MIVDYLLDEKTSQSSGQKYLQEAINFLKKVPGMSIDQLKLTINDKSTTALNFSDGSGKLFYVINAAQIHHVYIFDEMNFCRFAGYVGWIHSNGLKNAVELIKNYWC